MRLIGSGMAVMTIDLADPPTDLIENGEWLVEHLIKFGDSGIADATLAAASALWTDWNATGLPASLAMTHIAVLPGLLARNRPSRYRISELVASQTDALSSSFQPPADSIRLAAFIVAHAQATGDIERLGLSRQITFYLIERLFAFLAPHRGLLWPMQIPLNKLYQRVRLEPRQTRPTPRLPETTAAPLPMPLLSIA
ncbi:MAG: hypothetical protein R3D67_18140 [Hyphomicrobiaceae bacterium]